MKRIISALMMVATAGIGVAGCGGDDDDSSKTSGGTGNLAGAHVTDGGAPSASGGTGNLAGAPVTEGGAANTGGAPPSSGNVMCDEKLDGVCQNPTDCPSVVSGDARMAAGKCGQDCLGNKDKTCTVGCIVMKTSMTPECATCYAQAVGCATQKCLAQCIENPEADKCKICQVEQGCRDAFNTCSGLPE